MATSGSTIWLEHRIERALLWFYRIVVGVLGVSALARGELREAAILGGALAAHALIYLVARRYGSQPWAPWAASLLDMGLVGLVFYLTGDISGPAFILGFLLAGVLAARLNLWPALGASLLLYIAFAGPFFYLWLALDEAFPPPIVGNLLLYLALTLAINYLVSLESRQMRVRRYAERVDEMAALQRITRELNATLATEHILQVVLNTAVETTGATHGHVLLADTSTGQFELGVTLGYTEEEEAAIRRGLLDSEDENRALAVPQAGRPVLVADSAADPVLPCVKAGTRSALAVPIFYAGTVVGVINLYHRQPEAFDQRDMGFVESLAEHAALAIGNALRYQEQVRLNKILSVRTEQMSSLLEVSRKLRTDVPLEDTLEEIAYAIQETIGFDLVLISICEGVPGMMHRLAAAGLPLDQLEEMKRVRQPVSRFEGLYREEYQVGSCYFYPFQAREKWAEDLHTFESRAETGNWREGEWHPRDMLLVPLRGAGGRLLGQISVDEPRDGQRPSRQTLNALAIFANQAAIAVENARLYADVQRRADSLAQLNQVGRSLSQVMEPAAVLTTLARAVVDLLHCTLSIVYQPEEENGSFRPVASAGLPLPAASNARREVRGGLVAQAAEDERPLLIANVEVGPADLALPVPVGSLLVAPLLAGRQCLGVVLAGCAERGVLTEADQVLLATLADQAAVALKSARLFDGTQQAAVRISLLNEIGRRAAAQLEFGDMLETTVRALHQNLGYARVAVFLLEHEPSRLVVAAASDGFRPVIPEGYCLEPGGGAVGIAAADGETVLVQDARSDARCVAVPGWDCLSSLSAPIKLGGTVLGVLHAEAQEPRAFQEEDAAALEMAADQLAVAIQNARLFQERERRIRELAALNQMAQAVTSTLDLPTLLRTVYEQTARLMDASSFYIALYDEENDEVAFPFVVNPEGRGDWVQPRPGEGLVDRIVHSGQPLLLPRGTAEAGSDVRSWLGVPMIAGDRVLGAIVVQSYSAENVYDEEHLDYLLTVASQSAMAVRNAQLYQQIVRFSSELEGMVEVRTRDLEKALGELTLERDRVEALYSITRELGASLELDRVLERTLQLFARALGLEHGTILLLDQETDQLRLRATLERGRRLPREGKATGWRRGRGLAGWVLEHREPVLIADVQEDERWVAHPDKEMKVRSVVAAPLALGGGDVLGVLILGHEKAGYFTGDHLQLVTAATSQIAIAVNNSDLYSFITDQADQLGAALQAKQEEAAKNRAILESIADGVLVLDHNGRVLLLNPAAEELLGFAAMALEGEHFRHMLGLGITQDDRDLAQALYGELRTRLEAEDGVGVEQRASIRLEAGKRALAVNIAPLVLAIGGTPGLVAALRDISRQAEVERLKNEFISTVSHELRTPMTSIKGYTDLLFLGMAGGLTDAQRNFLQIIKSNADRLTALVNDILDISRIETGRLRLAVEPLNLVQLIDQVLASFAEQYREKGLHLQWNPPAALEDVRGDAARVTQILNNLLANAWQYTAPGGSVRIRAEERDRAVHVHVEDTGIGIAADNLSRVFDRFYRVDDPAVQEAGGTGLGLSIVKLFVEMLGGEVWVESEPGKGSTFSFSLPLAREDLPESMPDLLVSEPQVALARRPKILVVEDDRDLALLLRRELELDGYQVVLAGSGEDALWLAREEQPQLIALDIMLPDIDGFAVLERLKAHPGTQPIPVIITSVLDEPERGYALGAVDYILKPFGREVIQASVRRALSALSPAEPRQILVVDDDLDIRALLCEALQLRGYNVRTAATGREALESIAAFRPDLLVLDISLPGGMDGYEVIRRLKRAEATRSIPIVVVTASQADRERDKVQALGMGVNQYLTKPLSIENLIDEIAKAIAAKHAA
jgi:PAS domain S-box-containing protein